MATLALAAFATVLSAEDEHPLNAVITCSMQDFLGDLKQQPPPLQPIRQLAVQGQVDQAADAYAERFRSLPITTPLLRDWEDVPRDPTYATARQDGVLDGHLYDGYSVHDVPEEGLDWYNAPLTCLTRFPLAPAMQAALHHTRDPKYLRFLVHHLDEYMEAYPMEEFLPHGKGGYGWIDGLTVSRPWHWAMYCNRIRRMAEILEQVRHYDAISDRELMALLHRFYQETAYMRREMKVWVDRRHNGGGAMISAMIAACAVLQDFRITDAWSADNTRFLNQYIRESFYPDGCCVELTCAYSSSVASNVQNMVWAMGDNSSVAVDDATVKAIQQWLVAMSKPTGGLPSFGDLYVGSDWHRYLHRPLASQLGQDRLVAFAEGRAPDPGLAEVFPAPGDDQWCGYYVMRSGWDADARYLAIDGGPWGTTHSHGDKLSFVLSAFGADFIVDPGSTKYHNNEPDAFLSTQKPGFLHNTITVNGKDEFLHGPREAKEPLENVWRHGPAFSYFASSYDFEPLESVRWERRVLFVGGDYWLVQDVLTGAEGQRVEIEQNMQLAKDIEVTLEDRDARCSAANGAGLLVHPLDGQLQPVVSVGDRTAHTTYWPSGKPRTEDWSPTTEEIAHGRGWNGRGGNKLIPAPAVTWKGSVTLPAVINVLLVPSAPEKQAVLPEVEKADAGEGTTLWRLPAGSGRTVSFRAGLEKGAVLE